MRILFGLALAAALVLGAESPALSQTYYGPPVRAYSFKNESILSINNSYLGYGNLTYIGPNPPAPPYATRYGQALNQGYLLYPVRVPAPAPVPAPRTRWFRRW